MDILDNKKINILCFGDSNTWGCVGRWQESELPPYRYDAEHRWSDVMAKELGEAYHVVTDALCGRTTIYTHRDEGPTYSAEPYILPCMRSHSPLDLMIIMLGSNDIYNYPDLNAENLGDGITKLIDMAQSSQWGRDFKAPRILIMAPIEVKKPDPKGRLQVYEKFRREEGVALSKLFASTYKRIAQEKGCGYLNAAEFAVPCDADGLHMDPESQIRLGKAVAAWVKENL